MLHQASLFQVRRSTLKFAENFRFGSLMSFTDGFLVIVRYIHNSVSHISLTLSTKSRCQQADGAQIPSKRPLYNSSYALTLFSYKAARFVTDYK